MPQRTRLSRGSQQSVRRCWSEEHPDTAGAEDEAVLSAGVKERSPKHPRTSDTHKTNPKFLKVWVYLKKKTNQGEERGGTEPAGEEAAGASARRCFQRERQRGQVPRRGATAQSSVRGPVPSLRGPVPRPGAAAAGKGLRGASAALLPPPGEAGRLFAAISLLPVLCSGFFFPPVIFIYLFQFKPFAAICSSIQNGNFCWRITTRRKEPYKISQEEKQSFYAASLDAVTKL